MQLSEYSKTCLLFWPCSVQNKRAHISFSLSLALDFTHTHTYTHTQAENIKPYIWPSVPFELSGVFPLTIHIISTWPSPISSLHLSLNADVIKRYVF